jgi:hypothetical protein
LPLSYGQKNKMNTLELLERCEEEEANGKATNWLHLLQGANWYSSEEALDKKLPGATG